MDSRDRDFPTVRMHDTLSTTFVVSSLLSDNALLFVTERLGTSSSDRIRTAKIQAIIRFDEF